jgi:hypothetical protein
VKDGTWLAASVNFVLGPYRVFQRFHSRDIFILIFLVVNADVAPEKGAINGGSKGDRGSRLSAS